jgi:hypothetical protein
VDHSQFGESTVIAGLLDKIGPRSRHIVEFGCGNGYSLSNARMFLEDGWDGTLWDTETWVTAENVNQLFREYHVPHDVDVVCIDIDGNDYWVWKALEWEPSILMVEYNAYWPHGAKVAIEYDPAHVWDMTADYSASLDAFLDLGRDKGYFLAAESHHTNLIFVHDDHCDVIDELDPGSISLPWDYWFDHGGMTRPFVEV